MQRASRAAPIELAAPSLERFGSRDFNLQHIMRLPAWKSYLVYSIRPLDVANDPDDVKRSRWLQASNRPTKRPSNEQQHPSATTTTNDHGYSSSC